MKTIEQFPHRTIVRDPVFITLSDGARLAARIWLPEDAGQRPVPAILEYLPYRRKDGTAERDALTHPYFAGHGYACVRVDMRGAGDSQGVLRGEYLKQEQDDALEIIDWIVAQPWCAGTVGMIGISWGGFNGLQVAARRPPALKAIVSICSTDDRYADDIHYMGGCLLNDNAGWNGYMFSINTTPPDPDVVGNRWHEIWMDRLRGSGLWLEDWLTHQRRDAFYKHGSVCENFADIEAAVYAVGGWADGYVNAVFRLLAGLQSPCKGLVGPWAHKYPHFAKPGPQIGFLQECLRWWDHWLKGVDTGIMDEPLLRCWLQDPVPPRTYYEERPGRWVAEPSWPSPRIQPSTWHLNRDGLAVTAGEVTPLTINSPLTVGLMAGQWCPHGLDPDQSGDQRSEAGGSLVFDSEPLSEAVEILGAPVVELDVACEKTQGMVAVCLSEILPDGAATRVTYGLLNLSHRDSHEQPEPLQPGKRYRVRVQLNDAGHRFAPGNRIRIAVSSAYWPIAWPSPEKTTLTISGATSTLTLPVRPERAEDADLQPFAQAEGAAPLDATVERAPEVSWTIEQNMLNGNVTVHRWFDEGRITYNEHAGWTMESIHDEYFTIHPEDPGSARLDIIWTEHYERGVWQVSSQTRTVVTSTPTHFRFEAELEAREGDEVAHTQRWSREFERDNV
ncbi:MAG: CocE/NonD family hydrolase [Gammaproteobacteria bacterium]|nr:CocE/NonD family hydrolase [Gammaproteobacteria bacterium]